MKIVLNDDFHVISYMFNDDWIWTGTTFGDEQLGCVKEQLYAQMLELDERM